jgi:hypothetical protein
MWFKRFGLLIVGIEALLIASACDRVSAGLSGKPQDRFELRQDNQGRLIRLDKSTGEIVIVEGTRLIPLAQGSTNRPTSESTVVSPSPRLSGASNDRPVSIQPTSKQLVKEDAAPLGSDVAIITTTATAPVFATADRKGRALVVAAKGSRFRVVGEHSDSYVIDFTDTQLGHRTGYVEKKLAEAEPSPPPAKPDEPVNELILEGKPKVPKPERVDVSIPSASQKSTITIVVAAPIFRASNEALIPLRIAKEGSIVRLITQDGDWCDIEFQDPEFGLRRGYVRTRFLWVPTPTSAGR